MKPYVLSFALAVSLLVFAPPSVAEASSKAGFASQTKKRTSSSSKRRSTKKSTKKSSTKKTTTKTPTPKVDPAAAPMVATWYTMDTSGKFVKANRFVFTKYGEFRFAGPGWTSEGTFKLVGSNLNLSWTKIDGKAVKVGTVKKTLPVAEDKKSFQLDRFKYGKAS